MAGKPATLKINIVADSKSAATGLASFAGGVGGIASSITSTLMDMAEKAGEAIEEFVEKAVEMGIDAQKASMAVDRAFGTDSAAAQAVKDFGKTSAETMGILPSVWDQSAAKMAASLKNMGLQGGEAAQVTMEAGKRAADLAAQTGSTWTDAFNALEGVARGKTKGIGAFSAVIGKDLTKAQSEAIAKAGGLEKGTTTASDAIARMTIAMQQTGYATGAWGDYTKTTAGKIEEMKVKFSAMQEDLGTKLLPVIDRLVSGPLTTLINYLNDHQAEIERFADLMVTGFIDITQMIEETVRWLIIFYNWGHTAFTAVAGAVGAVANVFGVVLSAWVAALDAIAKKVGDVFAWIGDKIDWLVKKVKDITDKLGPLGGALGKVAGIVGLSAPPGGGSPSSGPAAGTTAAGATSSNTGATTINVYGQVHGDDVVAALVRYTTRVGTLSQAGVRL